MSKPLRKGVYLVPLKSKSISVILFILCFPHCVDIRNCLIIIIITKCYFRSSFVSISNISFSVNFRNQLHTAEENIRQRSMAAVGRWSCDKWQQSSAGKKLPCQLVFMTTNFLSDCKMFRFSVQEPLLPEF